MCTNYFSYLSRLCRICRNSSDIVREARQQHIMRPKILKEAAAKHNLFLAEDGSVLEIFDEEKSPKKKRGRKGEDAEAEEENGNDAVGKKKVRALHTLKPSLVADTSIFQLTSRSSYRKQDRERKRKNQRPKKRSKTMLPPQLRKKRRKT